MDNLTKYPLYFQQLLAELPEDALTEKEDIQDQWHIITHKLKFIPVEARPICKLICSENESTKQADYLNELLELSGAQVNPLISADEENCEKLIFINSDPAFIGQLPELISSTYAAYTAVEKNQVYVIQKEDFGEKLQNYLVDTEILAEIVQSTYFIFGHQGKHWLKFEL